MEKGKQLTVLLSCLSETITTCLILLQLHGILLLKIIQQKKQLQQLHSEAVISRNLALARYHRLRKR